ncbi:MAG: tetratricopeptide repeat protein [Gammaproteobacteria bacterium]|nr:tetratricopeptide repeat protein [Gammaproteobacteria bacterium]
MSLINDMLKDLDARRTQPAFANLAALPGADNSYEVFKIPRNGLIWAVAAMFLLGTIAVTAPLLADYFADATASTRVVNSAPLADNTIIPLKLPDEVRVSTDTVISTANQPVSVSPPPVMDAASSRSIAVPAHREEPRAPEEAVAVSSITVNPSPGSRPGNRDYHMANRAAAAGNDLLAIRTLEQLLLDNSDHHDARLLLASLYIRRQQHARAESLLVHGLSLHPDHSGSARLLARLLVSRGQHTEAIVRLEAALAGASRDAEYHALLAGLYQHSGNPAGAERHYTEALTLNPGRGEWWMGLGISREQTGNASAAGAAYRKALEYPLDTALHDYINTRLQLITRNDPSGRVAG